MCGVQRSIRIRQVLFQAEHLNQAEVIIACQEQGFDWIEITA